MAITEDEIFVCDFCGDDTGRFNSETGNHPACEKLAALKVENERLRAALEKYADEENWSIRGLRYRPTR